MGVSPQNLLTPAPPSQPRLNRPGLRKLLSGDDVYGSTLLTLAVDTFGANCVHWHPRALRRTFNESFAVSLQPSSFAKLMAAAAVVSTDLLSRTDSFLVIANALCGASFDNEVVDIADVLECAWGVTEAHLLHPPEGPGKHNLSEETCHYLGHVLREEGFSRPPAALWMAVLPPEGGTDWSTDPDMFAAISDVQQGRVEEVNHTVDSCLIELLMQVHALPLRHGVTERIGTFISQRLRGGG